jgi:CHAT domain-containing protein
VLSACETGGGKVQAGEGVFGMQRAMTAAGAQVVVMSLFKANDAVTQKLMQQFYQNWLITGEIRESFLQARNTIRKIYPDPSAWAGFIMVGQ